MIDKDKRRYEEALLFLMKRMTKDDGTGWAISEAAASLYSRGIAEVLYEGATWDEAIAIPEDEQDEIQSSS